jgi:spermidine/putrescine transport system substrate-binding protein
MKKFFWIFTGLVTSTVIGLSSLAQDRVLNMFTWADYIDPALVKSFEQTKGVKVNLSYYASNPELISKLSSGLGKYDLVVPSDYAIGKMLRLHLLRPLETRRITNLKNLADRFRSPSYDIGNKFSVAYQWGSLGIAYRKDKVKTPGNSWALLFDKTKQPGKIALYAAARETLGSALLYLGKSMNSTIQNDLAQASKIVKETLSRSTGSQDYVIDKERLAKGELSALMLFSSDALQLSSTDPKIGYFIPKEGAQIYVDNLAIPVGAPHSNLAHEFIQFLLEPSNGAILSNYTKAGTPNDKSRALIDSKDAKNLIIYPASTTKLVFLEDLSDDKAKLFDDQWSAIIRK